MRGSPIRILRAAARQGVQMRGMVVGTLLGFNALRQPLVSFAGAPRAEVAARLVGDDRELVAGAEKLIGRPVLLAFEGDDALRPLILGVVHDTLAEARVPQARSHPSTLGEPGQALTVNGRSLTFNAQEEIVFRCGQGSITVRADGSIVIKGTKLLSRASQVNKIRGASVQIN
jgi:hypothetical protein